MATNPQFPVLLTENTWTKIASAVVTGTIYNKNSGADYFQTYRIPNDPAPTDLAEGVGMFLEPQGFEEIKSDSPIDVYVYALGDQGKLRVDL